jgi:cytochrome c oxidase cbb3-type subunit 4
MDISITDVRAWMTILQMAVFLGIVWWAYGKARKGRFEEAAKIVLEDEEFVRPSQQRPGK